MKKFTAKIIANGKIQTKEFQTADACWRWFEKMEKIATVTGRCIIENW